MPYSNVAHAGGKVFYNHLLKLSKYVDIDLLCYYDLGEEVNKSELEKICKTVELIDRGSLQGGLLNNIKFQIKKIINLFLNKYIILGYPVAIKMYISKLQDMLIYNEYDVIELSFTSSLTYLSIIKKIRPNIKINIIEHDVSFLNLKRSYELESTHFRKFLSLLRFKIYKKSEIELLKKCDLITVLNDKDRRLLLSEGFSDENIYTEAPYFQHPDLEKQLELKSEKIKNSILFFGAMWRKENDESIYQFLVNSFPKILQKNPDVKLFIVGNKPTDRVKEFNDDKNIFVTGFVEDSSEYFNKCQIFIVPLLLGAGIKIKTLEALSYGLPVVSTTIGIEGIDGVYTETEKTCIKTDDFTQFEEEVVNLLQDEEKCMEMSQKSIEFIIQKYDLEAAVEGLYRRYQDLL